MPTFEECQNIENSKDIFGRSRFATSLKDNGGIGLFTKNCRILYVTDLKKKDLEEMAGVSHYVINKLTHGDNVTTDVLGRICKALDCSLDDIMEFVDD